MRRWAVTWRVGGAGPVSLEGAEIPVVANSIFDFSKTIGASPVVIGYKQESIIRNQSMYTTVRGHMTVQHGELSKGTKIL